MIYFSRKSWYNNIEKWNTLIRNILNLFFSGGAGDGGGGLNMNLLAGKEKVDGMDFFT